MLQTGSYILYGSHGICKILDLEVRLVGKKKVEYYVLEPVEQSDSRYYVPSQTAATKLRPMITKEELRSILHSGMIYCEKWIQDENARKQYYRDLLSSGDRAALMRMVHTMYEHKEQQQASGRKVHICDENFLRDARKVLDNEFSLVLGLPQGDVAQYIQNELNI